MFKLWDYVCFNGHEFEALVDSKDDKWSECKECGHYARRQIGGKGRMLYYEEGRARIDYHLGHKPLEITSERQHQKLMKASGVTLAGTRRGMKGQWI